MPKLRTQGSGPRRTAVLSRFLLPVAVVLLAGAAFLVEFFGGQYGIPTWQDLHTMLGVEAGVPKPDVLPEDSVSVTVLDVGQGSAALIAQGGEYCLIDAGPSDARQALVADLRQLGVQSIKLMVLTHPHSDHIGGAEEVLECFAVDTLLVTSTEIQPTGSGWQSSIYSLAQRQGVPIVAAAAGQSYLIGKGTLTVLQSGYIDPQQDEEDALNDTSICTKFTAGTFSYLSTGDAEAAAEQALVDTYRNELRATVLTAGHHGSYTSSQSNFLAAVRPQMAAISCGVDNDYGHPHEVTLRRLAEAGAEVYRTDTMGSITFTWQNEQLSVETTLHPEQQALPAA